MNKEKGLQPIDSVRVALVALSVILLLGAFNIVGLLVKSYINWLCVI